VVSAFLLSISGMAQKINYSDPERDDTRRTNFEIIGRVGGNFLVFKNNRSANDISVYDASMKLIDRVKQTDAEERWINVDFISYPDFAWMIYQYQRKNLVYCMAVKVDGKGKRISEPIEIDTTRIGWSANNKIYSTIYSDDKKKILIFKINNRNQSNFRITTLLFDNQLSLQQKVTMDMPMEERNEYFSDFLIDNEGELFFAKFIRRGNDQISDISMVSKKPSDTAFVMVPVFTNERILDEIKLKIDNNNRWVLFNAFYYRQRRGNIEGLYTKIWEKDSRSFKYERELVFTEEMRKLAKGPDGSLRMAFDDFFITNVITRKDGGFMLLSESTFVTSRGNLYDRWGNRAWNNPWLSPLDYYYWSPYFSPYSSLYWDRWNYGRGTQTGRRYHSENIYVFSFDKEGKLEWSNAISKSQFDDETDALISHLVFVSGTELQLLFNLYERRTLMLNNQGITPDGTINRYPTLKNLDREVEFMPRFGKQVSARSVVIPCLYRNNLIFAKIEF
jgi:hypothetical protein